MADFPIYLCNQILKTNGNDKYLTTENGEEIFSDNMIVEFRFDKMPKILAMDSDSRDTIRRQNIATFNRIMETITLQLKVYGDRLIIPSLKKCYPREKTSSN